MQLYGHHPLIISGCGGAASDSRSRSERRQQGGTWMRAMNLALAAAILARRRLPRIKYL